MLQGRVGWAKRPSMQSNPIGTQQILDESLSTVSGQAQGNPLYRLEARIFEKVGIRRQWTVGPQSTNCSSS